MKVESLNLWRGDVFQLHSLASGLRLRRSHTLSGTLPQRDDLICGDAGKVFFAAVGPDNNYAFRASVRTQTEVRAGIVAAQVALRWIDPGHSPATAGGDCDFGAVRIAASKGGIDDAHSEPVAAWSNVAVRSGRSGDS